jgi:hypothetical protein
MTEAHAGILVGNDWQTQCDLLAQARAALPSQQQPSAKSAQAATGSQTGEYEGSLRRG